jgi:iron complex outermembrane receptor protein
VSLDRQLTPDVLLYVKAGQGYRSGGENQGGSVDAASFAAFGPETNVEFEAGIKSEFLDHRIRLNFDAYNDNYTGLQLSTPFIDPANQLNTAVTNAATAKIRGLEAEADALVAPGLRLHASGAYTDARFGTFVDIVRGDRSHEPFTVPKLTWSLSGRYARPMDIGEAFFELDYNWTGSVVFDGTANYRGPVTESAHGVLNGRLNLHVNAWDADVALFGKNIASQKYYNQAFDIEAAGFYFKYAAAPATFGVEVLKHFGGK